jgi:hypothetical protein
MTFCYVLFLTANKAVVPIIFDAENAQENNVDARAVQFESWQSVVIVVTMMS